MGNDMIIVFLRMRWSGRPYRGDDGIGNGEEQFNFLG